MEPKTKKRSAPTALSILKGLHLQEVAIVSATAVRHIRASEAPRGSVSSQIDLSIKPTTVNGQNGVLSNIKHNVKGFRKNDSEAKELSFTLDLELEGFFTFEGRSDLFEEKDITELFAHAATSQLFPLLVMQTNEYIASMGYKNASVSLKSFVIETIKTK